MYWEYNSLRFGNNDVNSFFLPKLFLCESWILVLTCMLDITSKKKYRNWKVFVPISILKLFISSLVNLEHASSDVPGRMIQSLDPSIPDIMLLLEKAMVLPRAKEHWPIKMLSTFKDWPFSWQSKGCLLPWTDPFQCSMFYSCLAEKWCISKR